MTMWNVTVRLQETRYQSINVEAVSYDAAIEAATDALDDCSCWDRLSANNGDSDLEAISAEVAPDGAKPTEFEEGPGACRLGVLVDLEDFAIHFDLDYSELLNEMENIVSFGDAAYTLVSATALVEGIKSLDEAATTWLTNNPDVLLVLEG